MAAEGDNIIVTYIFTGEEERDEDGYLMIPQNVTHLLFHESVTVIPEYLCYEHPNIIEVYCHAGVIRIKKEAFYNCSRLRRVIIPGVEVVECEAFGYCQAVTDIKCPKLERIQAGAFEGCKSLRSINLPSAKIAGGSALSDCFELRAANFGKHLEAIGWMTFASCPNLERITIPLKDGLFAADNIFDGCDNLKRLNLVEGSILVQRTIIYETVAALHLEEWRTDLSGELDSINQILPNAYAAIVIREWITRALRKIIHYKAEHSRLLNVAATILHLTLPNDIVINNVLPFLQLPSYEFDGENQEDDDEEEENDSNVDYSSDETNISEEPEEDDYYVEEGDDEEGEEDEDDNNDELEEQDEGGDV